MAKFLTLCILLISSYAGLSQTPASFSTHNVYTLNSNYIQAIGDLNNDGYQDLINFSVGGLTAPRTFSVLLAKGDGTYRAPITYTLPTGSNVANAVLADFNGDGKLDMVVESAYDGGFSVYLGNGDGTFRAPVAHSVTEPLPVVCAIAAADVNGDSKTDLLVETTDQRDDYDLQVFFSNGDGTFTAGPLTYNLVGGALLTGDFNGDGKTDFASNEGGYSGSELEIWLGDGTGNFKMSYSDGSVENFEYVAADLNGDGISDIIATANQYCASCANNVALEPYFTVYYGQSDGTVERAQVPTTGCPIFTPVVADLNGDGIPDIAFGGLDCDNTQPDSISILFGKGNGQFGSQASIYTFIPPAGNYVFHSYPAYILRGNRDTKADLVVNQQNTVTNGPPSSNHIITLLNTTTGNFPTCTSPNAAVGINVCSPAADSTVSSPVNFAVGASGDTPMRTVAVWADGKKQAEQLAGAFSDYSFFNNSLPLAAGSHKITVFATGWDNSLQSTSFTVNVGGSSSCSAPTSPSVHVCSPANGAGVSSPVQVTATATVTGTIANTQLWVDGVKKFTSASNTLNTSIALSAGSHRFAVLAINTAGQKWETAVEATVK